MYVGVVVEFRGERREPLGALIRRVAGQFEQSRLEPEVVATFSDGPGGIRNTSAVERAIRKHPQLAQFERNDVPGALPGIPAVRRLTNADSRVALPMIDILALADGVPRSLPFHVVSVHFRHAEFGSASGFPPGLAPAPGVTIGDSWWVNGRNRDLSAFYVVEGDAASKKLPDPPAAIGAILAGLGKAKRTAQFVPPTASAGGEGSPGPSIPREIAVIGPIVAKYRAGMPALLARISLPHDLPPAAEARLTSLGARGPLRPALVSAFASRGYDCRGGSGTFTLRRRTAANHVVELELDVGTWSRSLTFMFHVRGPGFNATLLPPVSARDEARQYPIGDTANWERIVANVAAIVDELERTFVRELEAAAGPAPAWFDPGQ